MESMLKDAKADCDAILKANREYSWFHPIAYEIDGRTVYYTDKHDNVVAVDSTTGEIALIQGGSR